MGMRVYQYLDRSVLDLGPADQLVLWSVRQWVAAARAGRCPCTALGAVWGPRNLRPMLADFHLAMQVLDSDGLSPLRFKHLACAELGDDEALLLSIFAAAREGGQAMMQGIVEQVVKPEAQHTLMVAVGRVCMVLPG